MGQGTQDLKASALAFPSRHSLPVSLPPAERLGAKWYDCIDACHIVPYFGYINAEAYRCRSEFWFSKW